jgi:hypothetical protein
MVVLALPFKPFDRSGIGSLNRTQLNQCILDLLYSRPDDRFVIFSFLKLCSANRSLFIHFQLLVAESDRPSVFLDCELVFFLKAFFPSGGQLTVSDFQL